MANSSVTRRVVVGVAGVAVAMGLLAAAGAGPRSSLSVPPRDGTSGPTSELRVEPAVPGPAAGPSEL